MTNKQKIIKSCKEDLNGRMAVSQEDMRRLRESAGRNADDNMSEVYESNQQEMLNEMRDLQKHFDFLEESAAVFNRIDFDSSYDEVQPGAVVVTEKHTFLVGISGEFESEGTKVNGISASAPIYQVMKGKKAGDEFSLNSIDYTIREIH